jgi:ABC-type uncharacterized transport system involved in gliding motility auxiliary subunit
MTANPRTPPSFSPGRRWKIGFDVVVRTALVLAVVVMANYTGGLFNKRFYLSSQTRIEISPRTLDVLHSLTNQITVTLYYDTQEDFYPTILSLLNAYQRTSPNNISVRTVDYVRDPGDAERIKAQYKLNSPTDKNLIIFDNGSGRLPKIIPGDALAKYTYEQVPNEKEREFRKKPVAFLGEMLFTSALLMMENAKPFKAYFLEGHGEPSLADSSDASYLKFAAVLAQNYVQVEPLALLGDSSVPDDCNLLIIAGPRTMLSNPELQKIEQYLAQGGRLFVLLDYASIQHPTGLEDILRHWGVNVGNDVVQDPQRTISGSDVEVYDFIEHPIVDPLTGMALELILPRPVSRINWQNPPADAPKVDELAFSGPASVLMNQHGVPPRVYPVMAAVEQNEVKGLASSHGGGRIVVVGDSFILSNRVIDGGANRDFAGYAVNWLLDRPTLLKGIGPRPVVEFRLVMTRQQQHQVRWLLLGALPGGVLMLGGLVWLRRRK